MIHIEHVETFREKPILVIGGGPSVLTDLRALKEDGFEPACVLSANEHGAYQTLFPVTHFVTVCTTHFFTKGSMEKALRAFDLPLIAPFPWADILMQGLQMNDSGIATVIAATRLGGSPIVVTGLDGFNNGRRYFHDSVDHVRTFQSFDDFPLLLLRQHFHELLCYAEHHDIRPVSGFLARLFPSYQKSEAFA